MSVFGPDTAYICVDFKPVMIYHIYRVSRYHFVFICLQLFLCVCRQIFSVSIIWKGCR